MKKIFILLFAVTIIVYANAQTVTPIQKTISVTGTAETEVTPDEIYVEVSLSEYNKKSGDKIDIESIKNNFLLVCKNMGLADSDVVVQNYSGWDGNYWWYQKNKKKNPDMKAGITYWVKVSSTQMMDELVDKLDDQATQNFSIAKTDYSKMDELKKELKIEAIKAAKAKAIYLTEAIGEQVGGAITINDPNEANNYPQPIYANTMLKAFSTDEASNTPAMNVDFKKIKLEFDVNVVFALK